MRKKVVLKKKPNVANSKKVVSKKSTKGKSVASKKSNKSKSNKSKVVKSKVVVSKKKVNTKLASAGRKKALSALSGYNSIRSNVSVFLKDKGYKFNSKELAGYSSDLYKKIKSKYVVGTPLFEKAIGNIDVFVEQYFSTGYFGVNAERFDWWLIKSRISELPQSSFLFIQVKELLPETPDYIGRAYNSYEYLSEIILAINKLGLRKNYYKVLQVFFRDDIKKKEFVYFLFVDENSFLLDFSDSDLQNYLVDNSIVNINEIYGKIDETPIELSSVRSLSDAESLGVNIPKEPTLQEVSKEQREMEKAIKAMRDAGVDEKLVNKFIKKMRKK